MPHKRLKGFTLAELLVCLAILAEIATFTIPKILSAQQNVQYNTSAKEAIATIAGAYNLYKSTNQVSASTSMGDLTQYLNYVQHDITSLVDQVPTLTSRDCSNASYTCYRLASGVVIWTDASTDSFGGTNSTNAIEFYVDPDGVYGNSTSGNSKSAQLYLYYTGRVTSRAYINSGTVVEATSKNPSGTYEPSWFSW